MLRKFITFLLVITIALMSITKPAFAESNVSSSSLNFDTISAKTSSINTSKIIDKVVDKATDAVIDLGVMITICYGADALAAMAFPPAAVVAPFCPQIVGGTASLETTAFATSAVAGATKGVSSLFKIAH